jgi:hypothetical protein
MNISNLRFTAMPTEARKTQSVNAIQFAAQKKGPEPARLLAARLFVNYMVAGNGQTPTHDFKEKVFEEVRDLCPSYRRD